MDTYAYQEAFGDYDRTSPAMAAAIAEWFDLYYRRGCVGGEDPCQRIAYTVVNKLVKAVFSEYKATAQGPFAGAALAALERRRVEAVQLALIGGLCGIKPWLREGTFQFTLVPRQNVLVFGADSRGIPTDLGTVERLSTADGFYTLLERRRLEIDGRLTLENRLYRSRTQGSLGKPVPLAMVSQYAALPERFTFPEPLGGTGIVWLRTPMVNCVDGSRDPVSVYAPAVGLIHSIDRNEFLLAGEFERGQSRILASADLLDRGQLADNLFVGLDQDPESLGLTVFAPALREQSFLARKESYLRSVETVIGLKRGMLSQVEAQERTATEIASSQGDYNLTVMDFQAMWDQGLRQTLDLCGALGRLYGLPGAGDPAELTLDWGNGVLYDEEKTWADYKDMVDRGLLRPELALAWRFNLPDRTEEDLAAIRKRFLPQA